jgi:hypothetical protein
VVAAIYADLASVVDIFARSSLGRRRPSDV